jgi:hypothetical protein
VEIVMAEGEESEENNHRITLHTQNTTLSHSYNMISCHSSYIHSYECSRGTITFVYLTLFCCKVCSM